MSQRPATAIAAAGLCALAGLVTPGAPAAAQPAPPADSALAFRPLDGPGDRFSVSDLTMIYERDLTFWANTDRGRAADLAWLDRHGRPRPGDTFADSSDIDVVDAALRRDPTAMTPEERRAAEPPRPPVAVGIPSPVAVAGSLVGGLALLVQLIAALAK